MLFPISLPILTLLALSKTATAQDQAPPDASAGLSVSSDLPAEASSKIASVISSASAAALASAASSVSAKMSTAATAASASPTASKAAAAGVVGGNDAQYAAMLGGGLAVANFFL